MREAIVLASASPRRRELLRQIGIEPEVMPSRIEEVIGAAGPQEAVRSLSAQKAADVAARCGAGVIVIGADTVVALKDRILGKPGSAPEAEDMIRRIQGASHQVYTGVTLILCGPKPERISFAERTDVEVYPMTEEEIRLYASCKEPMDKAGGYGIQGRFAAYIRGIRGDYTNVVGLPLGRTWQELKRLLEMRKESIHD